MIIGRTSRKKEQKNRKKNSTAWSRSRCEYQHDTFDNTNKLEAGPAAKDHDNEGRMRRSHASSVLSRRATSAAPAHGKNCRYSSISSRWDHEKTKSRISEIRRPRRYTRAKIKQKTKNNQFFIRTNTPAEYVPGITYVRAETPPHS